MQERSLGVENIEEAELARFKPCYGSIEHTLRPWQNVITHGTYLFAVKLRSLVSTGQGLIQAQPFGLQLGSGLFRAAQGCLEAALVTVKQWKRYRNAEHGLRSPDLVILLATDDQGDIRNALGTIDAHLGFFALHLQSGAPHLR